MSHVDHRRLQLLVQARQLQTHLHAQRGIEVGQRLVEQEDLGVTHDSAANGDTLALAAGQLSRLAFEQRFQLQGAGGCLDLARYFLFVRAGEIQGEGHVLAHRHVRIERVGLENHGQVAFGRADIGDVAPVQFDPAAADLLEPGDQAQQGGLAAAGWANKDHEFSITNVQVYAFDDVVAVEAFLQVVDFQVCHVRNPLLFFSAQRRYFTAPNDRPRTSCFWLIQPNIRMGRRRGWIRPKASPRTALQGWSRTRSRRSAGQHWRTSGSATRMPRSSTGSATAAWSRPARPC